MFGSCIIIILCKSILSPPEGVISQSRTALALTQARQAYSTLACLIQRWYCYCYSSPRHFILIVIIIIIGR